jgi:sensitive to high expression protein 9
VRQATREAKAAYEAAVQTRATSQRDLTDLLQRKSTWSSEDVSRFTSLVHQDHLNTLAESSSKAASQAADETLEREFGALTQVILERYHEEQVWSDKIRSASTYGSMIVLGVNVFVFLSAIVIVEPWKRKKLAEALGRRVEALAVETRGMVGIMQKHLDQQEQLLKDLMAKEAVVADGSMSKPAMEAPAPTVPSKDASAIAIESFLHGRGKEIQAALIGALAGTALCLVILFEFR